MANGTTVQPDATMTAPQGPPDVDHKMYTPQQWHDLLLQAVRAHDVRALHLIVPALNKYEQENVPPTTGEMLGAEAKGVAQFPGQALKGLGQTASDLAGGQFNKAAKDVVGGLGQGIKGLLQLPGTAAKMGGQALLGEPVTTPDRQDLLGQAQGYGSSTAALAAIVAPMLAKKAGKAIGALGTEAEFLPKGFEPFKPDIEPEAPPSTGTVRAPTGPEPTPAGATPTQPMTPIEGTGGRGFTAEGPPTKPVTTAMEALSKMQGQGGMASLDEIINRNAEVNKPLDTGTLTNEPPRVSGQKSLTFGDETTFGPEQQALVKTLLGQMSNESGMISPKLLYALGGMGAIPFALGGLKTLGGMAPTMARNAALGTALGGAMSTTGQQSQ